MLKNSSLSTKVFAGVFVPFAAKLRLSSLKIYKTIRPYLICNKMLRSQGFYLMCWQLVVKITPNEQNISVTPCISSSVPHLSPGVGKHKTGFVFQYRFVFPVLDHTKMQTRSVCSFVTSLFCWSYYFKIHLHCVYFYYWIFHCMNISQCVYLLPHWWTLG